MTLFQTPYDTILDTNGDPVSGGKINFYEAGTSTPLDTYSDEDLTTANANPVVADSSGRIGPIYLKPQPYKVVVTDASDVTIKTVDNYRPVATDEEIRYAATVGGTGNAITLTLDPAIIAEREGTRIAFKAGASNTGAVTVNVNSLGAIAVIQKSGAALTGDEIRINGLYEIIKTGTGYQLSNPTIDTLPVGLGPVPWPTDTAPSKWLLCYGQAVSRTTYAALFTVLSTTFGVGDGSTTFNMPDLRGRGLAGTDDMGGTAANRLQVSTTITTTSASASATVASATGLAVGMVIFSTNVPAGTTITVISGTTITMSANATATASGTAARFSMINDPQELGGAGGSQTETLITDQLASHLHAGPSGKSFQLFLGSGSAGWAAGANNFTTEANTGASGGGQPHPSVQPTLMSNFIIYAGV